MATTKKTASAKTKTKTTSGGEGAKGAASSREVGRDWQSATLARVRTLIKQAGPDIVEDVKWRKPSNGMRGVPVWERAGIICTGETYKDKVKLTFARGAALADPSGLFNAGFDGNVRRAIDIREGEKINEKALKALIRAAVALNTAVVAGRARKKKAGRVKG